MQLLSGSKLFSTVLSSELQHFTRPHHRQASRRSRRGTCCLTRMVFPLDCATLHLQKILSVSSDPVPRFHRRSNPCLIHCCCAFRPSPVLAKGVGYNHSAHAPCSFRNEMASGYSLPRPQLFKLDLNVCGFWRLAAFICMTSSSVSGRQRLLGYLEADGRQLFWSAGLTI